jgi:hypothetical protein
MKHSSRTIVRGPKIFRLLDVPKIGAPDQTPDKSVFVEDQTSETPETSSVNWGKYHLPHRIQVNEVRCGRQQAHDLTPGRFSFCEFYGRNCFVTYWSTTGYRKLKLQHSHLCIISLII